MKESTAQQGYGFAKVIEVGIAEWMPIFIGVGLITIAVEICIRRFRKGKFINIPLWTALLLMIIGVCLIVYGRFF